MNIHEIDFRYDWLSTTLNALKSGFDAVRQKGEAEDWFDGLWQQEHNESIFGIAFVATQAYILGTTQDANKIRDLKSNEGINKSQYYSDDAEAQSTGVSRITLINEIANYYKHHDEWTSWPNRQTTQVLARLGITEQTKFPCCCAAIQISNDIGQGNLENILPIVSTWRSHILKKYA